jgi:GTP-binding protein
MTELRGIVESSFVAGAERAASIPPPALAEVAFAGRSNVGKSSLLNALLGRRHLVRVGRTPGTTKQVNFFRARADGGLELMLVDLPGYGFAKRGKKERAGWGSLVETYLAERVTLRAVVLLVDVRRGPEREELELLDFLRGADARSARRPPELLAVATKIDKISAARRKGTVMQIGKALGIRAFGFSAMGGEGKAELWNALRQILVGPAANPTGRA